MRMTRRTLLIGAGAGALSVLLASCTPDPAPSPTPTGTPSPAPTGAVPAPSAAVRSTWSTDPFARGAASFTPVGAQPAAREALAAPIGERVFFAGEATDVEGPGTLSGAIRSGTRSSVDMLHSAEPGERVAIIGAGLAGATAAARLAAAGMDVTVFEARDRIGGRIDSRLDDAWPYPVQLGGWLLSAQARELREGMRTLELETVDLNVPGWLSPDGAVDAVSDEPIQAAIAAAQASPADLSLAEALTATGVDPADPSLAALLAYLAATTGADAEEMSGWFPAAVPVDDYTAALGDLGPFVKGLLDDVQVSLSSPVSKVAYDDTGVSLRLGTGESLSFDRVVITVPLGVLQQNDLEFDPALPFEHRGAITALAMGNIETVWLRFDEPFWDSDATIWHLVAGEATVRTWFNLRPGTGENVLVGMIGGAAAVEFAELDEGEALASALASLEPFVHSDDTEL